ncbi:unnamed protein product [Sympodiomycopsis kandeliae]
MVRAFRRISSASYEHRRSLNTQSKRKNQAAAAAVGNQLRMSTGVISTQGELSHLDSEEHIHVALAQVLPSSDENDNDESGFTKLKSYATEAAQRGADVVAFPEYFLHGATHDDWRNVRQAGGPRPLHHEEDRENHWIHEICELAKELDINIVAGTVVELGHHHIPHRNETKQQDNEPLFNTAYFIGRHGDIRGRYTKRNLWHPERETLSAGHHTTHPSPLTFTFTTRRDRKVTTGLQICWDIAFPESFRSLLSNDAPDIIFVPTCWYASDAGEAGLKWNKSPTGEIELLDSMTMARAIECEAFVCMINIAGNQWDQQIHDKMTPKEIVDLKEPVGLGRSTIKSPFLGTVGVVQNPQEKLLLASLNLSLLKDARDVYGIRKDLGSASKTQSQQS